MRLLGFLGVLVGFGALALAPSATAAPGALSSAPTPDKRPAGRQGITAPSPAIIPVAQVRAGMRGYGLTVFQGTEPERFEVRVVGVLRNFLPKQDVILIRSEDPRLVHSGIVAGMSGSPIYIEGRLAGALAYGWSFAKDPIAGVTPIESMLAELKRPLRGRPGGAGPTRLARRDPAGASPAPPTAMIEAARAQRRSLDQVIEARRDPLGRRSPLLSALPLPPRLGEGGDPRLVRAAVPLSLAGFGAAAFAELSEVFAPYHMVPLQAGGGAPADGKGPTRFVPGAGIAVQLVRGDVSMAGTGTVTHVDGDKVLAFGHPMFNVGEIFLPIATAEVHTFMAALSSSFKLASPAREVGSLLQDRQSGIVGDTSVRSDMIPVRVTVGGTGRPESTFHAEVVRHRFLTPVLAGGVISNAAQSSASDVADATITLRSKLAVRGYAPLELVDHLYSLDGASSRTLAGAAGVKAISQILFNPFAPANLDRIDVDVRVDYKADVAELVGVSLSSDELEPGSRPNLYATLRPYAGQEYVQAIPFEVPRSLRGQTIKIVAAGGELAKPDVAPPESLGDLLENLRKGFPARSIVIGLETPDEGVTLRGSVIPDLPASVIDTLRPGASSRRADTFRRAARFVVSTHAVVQGKQELTVRVRDDQAK